MYFSIRDFITNVSNYNFKKFYFFNFFKFLLEK